MPFTTETDDVVTASQGNVIMGHLGNATLKEELGRSTWKLLHTMVARYPEEPTTDEREALGQFIKLLSRLYPCGECAEHFQLLLEQYPPQTASRIAASQWACAIHNKVNERLHKDIFDCGTIEEKYPCGCDE
ncbi:ERV/ALR sulfhydryl oxidase domain-containing protein [Radiomyces spectabilis]|uniref:ERV/ALR sulfhydryl oxidase domain-containing protein n=1 Tax=Radiomyces spectabilis TaxID=64574 RepID=UPI00221FCF83|nr:ERV/ALR sulfhydryl oxidase domain-containing protein [Radiomyces spectabilis]KAI8377823.1 ERV/ALR sulfhydryl oxidase domain-containing protein [Radiomyces spectabilis]